MSGIKVGKRGRSRKGGIIIGAVTGGFAVLGTVFLIIGYQNEVLKWMATTGIALLVMAAIPLLVLLYNLINRKIES